MRRNPISLALLPAKDKRPMADHMSELIRDYLNKIERLPAPTDEDAIRALEILILDRIVSEGIYREDIEQQLGDLRDLVRSEIHRRNHPGQ